MAYATEYRLHGAGVRLRAGGLTPEMVPARGYQTLPVRSAVSLIAWVIKPILALERLRLEAATIR